jgi:signal transduction histidine kinase
VNLRWRLTLLYGAISALVLIVGGVALVLSLRSSLYGLLDESLQQATLSIMRRFDNHSPMMDNPRRPNEMPPPGRSGPNDFRPRLPADTSLTVFDPSGTRLNALDPSPVNAPLKPGRTSIGGYRVLTVRTPDGYWFQAARSEVDALGALQRTQQLLLLGLPLLLLLGMGAGYAVADRALRPVDAVSLLATRIAASGKPGERVPQALGNDEMTRLTRTVNEMLEKLEASLAQERAFALAAAHELRTPLAVLQGRVSLSLERERSPEHYRQSLQTVSRTTQELTRLVEGLLTLARSRTPSQPVALDLADIGLEVAEAQADAAKARGQRVELELSSAPAHGDPAALRLAASNLVRNAIRYAPEGGRIWVRSAVLDGQPTLEVRDDGPGVDAADLERLRRPFQRGQGLQAVQGSGLGLALVDAIAEQHGGRLELGRAPEGGLRAAIRLPETSLSRAKSLELTRSS